MHNKDTHYEFDRNEAALVGKLARTMRFVAIGFIVFGVIAFLKAFTPFFLPYDIGDIDLFPVFYDVTESFFNFAIGFYTLNVAKSFGITASDEGNDHPHLISALQSLTKMQTVQLVLLVLGTIVFTANWGKLLYSIFLSMSHLG